MSDDVSVRSNIRRWLDDAIVGLRLCPFAAPVLASVEVVTSDAVNYDSAVHDALAAARSLIDTPSIPTTLVAYTQGLHNFEAFLDVAHAVEDALGAAGAHSALQIATFHPDYRFAGADPDAVGNFTNRSPYPVIHLLRGGEVERAIAAHADTLGIPEANVDRLEAMGDEEVRRRWRAFGWPG